MSPLLRALLDEARQDPAVAAELADLLAPHLAGHLSAGGDRWLDTKGAADYLDITVNALHKLTAARAVPFSQDTPGGKMWFFTADLDAHRRGADVGRRRLRSAG